MTKSRKKNNHKKILIWLAAAVLGIFVALSALLAGVYKLGWNNRFLSAAADAIPLPAAHVQGAGFISVGELNSDVEAVKKFYDSQDFEQIGMRVDFSTDQGKKRLQVKEKEVLNKLIENEIIMALAKKRGINISNSAVDQEVDSSIEQYGNRQNLMSELSRLYGWSLADFKEKVVKPELYAEALAKAFEVGRDTRQQESKINALAKRVAEKKEDFAKVAASDSEGASSRDGGDLGWSTKEQLLPELADQAYKLKTGEISGVIASPLGFHIIKLEEKKNESGEELVHLRQIFIKTETFGDWLETQMKAFKVVVFAKDYQWNPDKSRIEFKNPELRQFEANLAANSEGDPSVFP